MTTNQHEVQEFADLQSFELDREMVRQLPEQLCREQHVVLLGHMPTGHDTVVPLGMLDTDNDGVVYDVEKHTHWRIRRIQLNGYEIDTAIEAGFGEDGADPKLVLKVSSGKERIELSHDCKIRFERGQSAPQIIVDLFSEAVKRKASDIHIEVYANDVDLRFRVDGVLQQVSTPLSLTNIKMVVSYIKILAGSDIIEKRRAQDGRIGTRYTDEDGNTRHIDMRAAVLPGPHGEDVVLRLLDEHRINYTLTELGMPAAVYERFCAAVHTPGGVILVTGPTASGKTTTLYAAIRDIRDDTKKILTVEEPIEYQIPKVNQKQISSSMTFADYARAFMRQNPDVLMIGEVRDEDTATITLRAAQMGHLVLSTLHTRDALSAVSRMLSLGADRSLLASGLHGVMSQRLIRRVCPHCSEPCEPDPAMLKWLPALPDDMTHVRGKGCAACFGAGYSGQTGVFELLEFNDQLRGALARGDHLTPNVIPDYPSMYDDAISKASAGVTTIEEVLRTVPLPDLGR